MALKLSITDAYGVTHSQAYVKASVKELVKEGEVWSGTVEAAVYASETTADDFLPLSRFTTTFVHTIGQEALVEAYNALKLLPSLSTAIDC